MPAPSDGRGGSDDGNHYDHSHDDDDDDDDASDATTTATRPVLRPGVRPVLSLNSASRFCIDCDLFCTSVG